jgi:hypothetical protein
MRSDLSERLNLSRDEGEKWIVNLIRETRMGGDAKIDLEKVGLCSGLSIIPVSLFLTAHSTPTVSLPTIHANPWVCLERHSDHPPAPASVSVRY